MKSRNDRKNRISTEKREREGIRGTHPRDKETREGGKSDTASQHRHAHVHHKRIGHDVLKTRSTKTLLTGIE